jgi:O-antigen ligase
LPVLLLVLYGAVSWLRSPDREFSRPEWIRLACGAGLYFAVASRSQREQVKRLVDALIAVVILVSVGGLVASGAVDLRGLIYPFGNAQLQSGFLMIGIPLLVVLAFSEPKLSRRLAAQAAAALALTAVALAGTRSAWLGIGAALVVLVVWMLCQGSPIQRLVSRKHELIVPGLVLIGGLGLFLSISQTASTVRARAKTLAAPGHDYDLQWRLGMWHAAGTLIRQRPLFGWGIGTFPLEQARVVSGAVPPALIQRLGPTLAEEAHNEYVQTAAELGLVGLGLSLWVLGAFFAAGWRALRSGYERSGGGLRQRVLLGCMAGIAAQTVDALSNPAWRFPEVSLLFWIMLGLGMAAASRQSAPRGETEPAAAEPFRGRGRLGWQGATLALTLLAVGGAWAKHGFCPLPEYDGPVQLRIVPGTVTLQPGQQVQFRVYANVSGNSPSTVELTNDPATQFFTGLGDRQCLVQAGPPNVWMVPFGACGSSTCGGGHIVLVHATYQGQPESQATAQVIIACPSGPGTHAEARTNTLRAVAPGLLRLDLPSIVSDDDQK